jgi:hypothetical protein
MRWRCAGEWPDRLLGRDGGADNRFFESMRSALIQKMNWTLESR